MTYDPIDTNDDGVVDADVDNQSVSTERGPNSTFNAESYPGETGGEKIQAALDEAAETSTPSVVVAGPDGPDSGDWLLPNTLEAGSHTTIVLLGSSWKLGNGVDDNILRNKDFDGGNDEIHVQGVGNAKIDGNAANQSDALDDWHEYGIYFYNVGTCSVKGVEIIETNGYSVVPEDYDSFEGEVKLNTTAVTDNQDGVHLHGPGGTASVALWGETGDDSVAVDAKTGLGSYGNGGDIGDVEVDIKGELVSGNGILRTAPDSGGPYTVRSVRMTGGTAIPGTGIPVCRLGSVQEDTADAQKLIRIDGLSWEGKLAKLNDDVNELIIESCQSDAGDYIINTGGYDIGKLHIDGVQGYAGTSSGDCINLVNSSIREGQIVNVSVSSTSSNAALNLDGATLTQFTARDLSFDGWGTGVQMTSGTLSYDSLLENITTRNTTTPWDVSHPSVEGRVRNCEPALVNGSVTLSTGASPAAVVSGAGPNEGDDYALQYLKFSGGSPGSNTSTEHYFEYDWDADEWDLIIEWRSDPGSNVTMNYGIAKTG